jgi:hypothetical protein
VSIRDWFYILSATQERAPWDPGTPLPVGADWSHYDFLAQFAEKTNLRKAVARMSVNFSAPDTSPLPVGQDFQGASEISSFFQNILRFNCVDSTSIPASGALRPASRFVRDSLDIQAIYSATYVQEVFQPVREIIDGANVFEIRLTQTAGTSTRRAWVWEYDPDQTPENFWEETDPPADWAQTVKFGAYYGKIFGSVFAGGARFTKNVANPSFSFAPAAAALPIPATIKLYYLGAWHSGDTSDTGFPAPGANRLVPITTISATPEAPPSGIDYAGTLGPTDIFRDYDPSTGSLTGQWGANFACYAEI